MSLGQVGTWLLFGQMAPGVTPDIPDSVPPTLLCPCCPRIPLVTYRAPRIPGAHYRLGNTLLRIIKGGIIIVDVASSGSSSCSGCSCHHHQKQEECCNASHSRLPQPVASVDVVVIPLDFCCRGGNRGEKAKKESFFWVPVPFIPLYFDLIK